MSKKVQACGACGALFPRVSVESQSTEPVTVTLRCRNCGKKTVLTYKPSAPEEPETE